ncbi:NADH dehydrogenase subunit C [Fodinibius sediminis]|uniref:NADH-quinone oxidoreductase subunit C n=2 Tax=Fodinibius sediminis TaxID=1214077 RepID=A0A521D0Z0_9BACT|nr:NADH dehydrogenase subunit C [Fodinibius sediminis]
MTTEEITEYLNREYGGNLDPTYAEAGDSWITVSPSVLREVAKTLRDDKNLQFNNLMCLSGIHYQKENELGVAYHLHSTIHDHKLVMKVRVPEDNPVVPSVESLWKTANWHEREAYDLVGITFRGHPGLLRILTPQDWEGHPLRKDYEQQESYRNVSTGI